MEDCSQIAELHKTNIQTGFISSLGSLFLEILYKSMIASKSAFCIVAEEDGKIVGFISGAISVGGFYKDFLRKNFLKANTILLPKLLNPNFVRKIFEAIFYPVRKDSALPYAELLSIVVDKNYRNKGEAQKLFEELVKEFRKHNIKQFKVVVGSNLKAACNFYEKMNGILHSEIEVHKGEKSKVYVWQI